MTADVTRATPRLDRCKLSFGQRVDIIRRVRKWTGTKDSIYRQLGIEFKVSHITIRRAYLGALPPRETRVTLLLEVAAWLAALPGRPGLIDRAQAAAYSEQLRSLAGNVR